MNPPATLHHKETKRVAGIQDLQVKSRKLMFAAQVQQLAVRVPR